MNTDNWGKCKSCKYWELEPDEDIEKETMGHCVEESIRLYQLRVSADAGCNHFEQGKSHPRREGASEAPPLSAH